MDQQQHQSKPVASKGFMQLLVEENTKAFETSPELGPEVAIQCLEKVFEKLVVSQAGGDVGGSASGIGSIQLGNDAGGVPFINTGPVYVKPGEASDGDKAAAEVLKTKGNDAMSRSKAVKGLDCYTKAIALDGNNPVYFCNRSAAYIKLEKFEEARRDCQIAIQLQPSYALAYGRMGLAYSSQKNYLDALLCFKKALALDPGNEAYKKKLHEAQQQIEIPVLYGSPDPTSTCQQLEAMFQNPNMAHAAYQTIREPAFQEFLKTAMKFFQDGGPQSAEEFAGASGRMSQMCKSLFQRLGAEEYDVGQQD